MITIAMQLAVQPTFSRLHFIFNKHLVLQLGHSDSHGNVENAFTQHGLQKGNVVATRAPLHVHLRGNP